MCNSKICVRVTPPERSVKRKKEKGRCLILLAKRVKGVKSGKHKRRRKRRKKNQREKKKRKKAKRVVQTPSPSLEKGRLSPFQFYFFIVNNYTCVCLLCLRERERESQIRATLVVEDTRARLPQQQRIDRSRNTRYTAHRYLLNS